jgi:hypothetical protein
MRGACLMRIHPGERKPWGEATMRNGLAIFAVVMLLLIVAPAKA